MIDELIRSATSRAGVVRVSNALNPLLWASVLAPVAWAFAYLFRDDLVLKYVFVTLGALPPVGILVAYFVLLIVDRDRLQSEEHQIRQRALQMVYRKGRSADIVEIANHVPRVESARPNLSSGDRK